jgi:hypothetical protein
VELPFVTTIDPPVSAFIIEQISVSHDDEEGHSNDWLRMN